ncbi:hypothetical protein ACFVXG_38540 [Kitasatospora sp. NPDC058162]|uniref:hypothetical protein n=1 Tax=Kitasatospora sp. NPDC058162 TaxID=3346362 RepID=UPI0036D9BABF
MAHAHHHTHGHQHGRDIGEILHRRFHFLEHRHRDHGGLDETVEPLPIDEQILARVAAGDPHEMTTEVYLAIEAWLTTAYTARRGCYADPRIHGHSDLVALVQDRAAWLYTCPETCPTTEQPGCDGCSEACAGGVHRSRARAVYELAVILDRDHWDAFCQAHG